MHIGRSPRLSDRCSVPREPMFSLADFAERKKLEYRSLVACMNGSAARPTPASDVLKTCRSGEGRPFKQAKHLYRLQDLEDWLNGHGMKVRRVTPAMGGLMKTLPSLIPNDRMDLLRQEHTAPAMLEAMIQRRLYSDTTTRRLVSIGPRVDLKSGGSDEDQTP